MVSSSRSLRRSPARWALAAATACAVAVAGVAVLAAERATSATATPTVRVSPTIVERGQAITVTGTRWPRGVTVQLLIGPPQSGAEPVGRVRTTSRGTFRRRLVPPAWVQARPGRWVVLACRRDCRVKAAATFRLTR